MTGPIIQAIQEFIARRQAGERPIRDAIVGAFRGQPQAQTPPPAPVRPRAAQPAPASSQGPRRGYDPQVEALQERLAAQGINPGPIDGIMGPQTMRAIEQARRSEMATPMAAPVQRPRQAEPAPFVPMQRPGSGAVPLPPANPSRLPAPPQPQTPPMTATIGGVTVPLIPPGATSPPPAMAPGWRPASGTPDIYGPGRAVPSGTPGTRGPEEWVATPDAIGNEPPRYGGGPNLYGYAGQGGIPRVEYGLGDMPRAMGALGRIDPAVVQGIQSGPQAQVAGPLGAIPKTAGPSKQRAASGDILTPFEQAQKMTRSMAATDNLSPLTAKTVRTALSKMAERRVDAALMQGDHEALTGIDQERLAKLRYGPGSRTERDDSDDVLGRFKEAGAGPTPVASWLVGSTKTQPPIRAARVAEKLKAALNAEQWASIRQATLSKLMNGSGEPGPDAGEFMTFFHGRGERLMTTMFSKDERDLMARIGNTVRLQGKLAEPAVQPMAARLEAMLSAPKSTNQRTA